ncbi:tigger transposable element-derived protein 6 [Elysia marginata]|uniref:Tigger transposable element-derived protein 6 n=1 Tax=Elysia marginata TaxID=1093978 RepID=A0AAV4I307_9GAST|nr:tigger transposable element-derived protein 6 [Elysia marginata]
MQVHIGCTTRNPHPCLDGKLNSTLSTILKDKERSYKRPVMTQNFNGPATKKTKLCSHEELEDAVFAWFRPVVIGKAAEIAQLMNFNFTPSPSWVEKFKQRKTKQNKKAINNEQMNSVGFID